MEVLSLKLLKSSWLVRPMPMDAEKYSSKTAAPSPDSAGLPITLHEPAQAFQALSTPNTTCA